MTHWKLFTAAEAVKMSSPFHHYWDASAIVLSAIMGDSTSKCDNVTKISGDGEPLLTPTFILATNRCVTRPAAAEVSNSHRNPASHTSRNHCRRHTQRATANRRFDRRFLPQFQTNHKENVVVVTNSIVWAKRSSSLDPINSPPCRRTFTFFWDRFPCRLTG
jgi:hypothetical protein